MSGSEISFSLEDWPPGFKRWACWDCGYSYLPSRDPPPYPECPVCGGDWIDAGPRYHRTPNGPRAPPPVATVPAPARNATTTLPPRTRR